MQTEIENNNQINIDIYSGDLNIKRIKEYKKIKEEYNIEESIIRNIFNNGADWAIKQYNKVINKLYNKTELIRHIEKSYAYRNLN